MSVPHLHRRAPRSSSARGIGGATALLLSAAVAILGCPTPKPPESPAGARLLAYLQEHQLLAGSGKEQTLLTETARIVAKAAATPGCPERAIASGLGDQLSGPKLIVRAVDLPANPTHACGDTPDNGLRELCNSLVDGCAATEDGVFCDRRWIAEIVALSVVYRRAIVQSFRFDGSGKNSVAPDDLLPMDLVVDLLRYWTALRAADRIDSVVPPASIAEASKDEPATAHALARALLSFGVGHELSHVLQHQCPNVNEMSPEINARYVEFTCGQTSEKELAADLAGIGIIRRVLSQRPEPPPAAASFNDAVDVDFIRNHGSDVWLIDHWNDSVKTALIHYAELTALQDAFGKDAPGKVRGEPALSNAPLNETERATFEDARKLATVLGNAETDRQLLLSWYYQSAARNPSAGPKAYEHHLPVAYRLYLLQTELAGSEWELAADRQLKKQRGLRFAGLLRELLPRMQALCEKRSAQEKERLTEEWLGGRLTGRQPFYFEGNVTSCRSRELIQQLFDHEITLTAADLLRGTDCTVPAGGHVNIVRRDDRFAEFEWVGLPGKTLWTTRNAVSRCPKPRPHNYILDDSPTLEVMCEVIRTELNVSGDRGAIAGRLLELPLRQATDGERRALRGDMDRNELCVMAEMREPTDTQECVIEVRGGTERAACAVDLTAFAKCLKTHPKSDRMSGCTESAVCKAAKP